MVRKNENIEVSVIIPLRNEENHIQQCIQSIISQSYPKNKLEIIFVDGLSEDSTKDVIINYIQKYPNTIRLLDNPHKTVPFAMNIGIKKSVGRYIMRLDAHSEYSNDYITKCISTIENIDADNVGGIAITKGEGFIGEIFSKVLSSKFGVGNSDFRTNGSSGYVDTVPFGTYKRETFAKYGFYDERLTRNQDFELNYRIRKNGGKIYLNSYIKLFYHCKNIISGILKQSYENGKWNIITSKLCPRSMSIRHFIPLFFLTSIIFLPIFALLHTSFALLFFLEIGLYFLLNLIFSIKLVSKLEQIPFLVVLFFIFHISYGFGSLTGLAYSNKKNKST